MQALGYLLLAAAAVGVSPERPLSASTPLLVVLLTTVGELHFSPVGLAMVGSASKGSSTGMGCWFLCGGLGAGALGGSATGTRVSGKQRG